MQSFLAMLLTLRVGLAPSPTDTAVASIRAEVLQVAEVVAERDRFVTRSPAQVVSAFGRTRRAESTGWGPPEVVNVIEKDDWRDIVADTLNGNQKIANAVMWLAAAPVRLRVSHEKVFLAITVKTP
jgi:hypothetical protein